MPFIRQHLATFFLFVCFIFYSGRIWMTRAPMIPKAITASDVVHVQVHGVPDPTNPQHVAIAMRAFGIHLPANTSWPIYNRQTTDRGLTTPGNIFYNTRVDLGYDAFSSWSILGSTLLHEVEVHCHQNVYWIVFKDLLQLNGTDDAERDAYAYEVANRYRVSLTAAEVLDIQHVVKAYYPM